MAYPVKDIACCCLYASQQSNVKKEIKGEKKHFPFGELIISEKIIGGNKMNIHGVNVRKYVIEKVKYKKSCFKSLPNVIFHSPTLFFLQ